MHDLLPGSLLPLSSGVFLNDVARGWIQPEALEASLHRVWQACNDYTATAGGTRAQRDERALEKLADVEAHARALHRALDLPPRAVYAIMVDHLDRIAIEGGPHREELPWDERGRETRAYLLRLAERARGARLKLGLDKRPAHRPPKQGPTPREALIRALLAVYRETGIKDATHDEAGFVATVLKAAGARVPEDVPRTIRRLGD